MTCRQTKRKNSIKSGSLRDTDNHTEGSNLENMPKKKTQTKKPTTTLQKASSPPKKASHWMARRADLAILTFNHFLSFSLPLHRSSRDGCNRNIALLLVLLTY